MNQQSVQGKKKMTSALHVACRNVNLPSVEFLVRNGANLELVEGSGQTALHVAAAHDVTGKCTLLHVHVVTVHDDTIASCSTRNTSLLRLMTSRVNCATRDGCT